MPIDLDHSFVGIQQRSLVFPFRAEIEIAEDTADGSLTLARGTAKHGKSPGEM
jgi:hypothetical protein